jgi:SNF2 family DNA or RNA helicase
VIFTPREYQRLIRNFIVAHPRCNVFAGMGLGKTSSSIEAYDTLRMMGESDHALVLAPKRVAETSWPDEIVKWCESFGHLTIRAAIGTERQRLDALNARPNILTINYDNIEWLIDVVGEKWYFDTVFADESPRLKGLRISLQKSKLGKEFVNGQGAKRAKMLSKIAHTKIRRWVNLTGSPAPNGLQDLWGQQFFVDKGQRLGLSFGSFTDRWFRTVQLDYGSKIEPLDHAHGEITRLMRDCSLTVDAKDWFDLKEPVETIVKVTLPPKARAAYDRMEDEYYTEVAAGQIEALNGGSKGNKCRQIASGAVFDSEGVVHHVHDAKIEALKSIITEASGASILVSYQYEPERDRILAAFPKARVLKGKKEIHAFQEGTLQIGVAHPASAGHGLQLEKNCWILVDFSTGWNLEEDEQILGRIGPVRQHQGGHDRVVYRYRIIAERTIEEEVVLPRIREKTTVQDAVKAAMKRRLTRSLC